MVQVRSFDLQHLDQLVILLENFLHLLQALLVSTQPPRIVGALIADKAQDLEERRAIVLNE